MKKTLLAVLVTLLALAVFATAPVFTAPGDKDLHANYDHDLLEVYFKRAESAHDEAQWRELVDEGIDVVKGRWESAALLEAGDPGVVAEEKAVLEAELETEKNQRLSEFLFDRFFRALSGPELEKLW
jgi:hypothetical protein